VPKFVHDITDLTYSEQSEIRGLIYKEWCDARDTLHYCESNNGDIPYNASGELIFRGL
jgi:hypothetical protein